MPANNFRTPEGDLENQAFITESWLIDQWIGDELWVWGVNITAEFGNNTTVNSYTPVTTFLGGNNWKQVHISSFNHTIAVTSGPDY